MRPTMFYYNWCTHLAIGTFPYVSRFLALPRHLQCSITTTKWNHYRINNSTKTKENEQAARHAVVDDSIHPTNPKNIFPVCEQNVILDTKQDKVASWKNRTMGRRSTIRQHVNEAYRAQAVETSQLIAVSLNLRNERAEEQTDVQAPWNAPWANILESIPISVSLPVKSSLYCMAILNFRESSEWYWEMLQDPNVKL